MARTAPRWLRSVRRRPAAFIAILLLAAGAALVSAVTPMLVDAVDAVSLRQGVADAEFPANGVSATALAQPDDDLKTAESVVESIMTNVAGASDRFGAPQQVDELQVVPRLFGPSRAPFATHLSLAPASCTGLRLTGRCPTSTAEGLLPSTLARSTGWGVGTAVDEKVPNPGGEPAYLQIGRFTVVGVYDDAVGAGPGLADPTRLQASAAPRTVLNVVVGEKGWQSYRQSVLVVGGVRLVRPVAESDVADLRGAVVTARQGVLDSTAATYAANTTTRLDSLLDAIGAQQAAASVLAAPIGLEAVLLAWFALGAVAQRTARSRAAEWGVGRMRGARVRAWLAFVFSEPLAAVLLGALLGYAAALGTAAAAAALLLGTAQDVEPFTSAVLAGVGLAVAGSLVALVAASVRAALLPLPQLLQDTAEPRQLTRPALVLQVALLSLAVAVAWAALTTVTFGGQQLGLLLPAMLALVAGIAGVRLAVLVVRRTSRSAPRSLLGLVVGRGLARAPSVLVAGQLILVSAALAACALQLGLLSAAAQTDRALLSTGADRVLTVQAPAGSSLVDLVRRADPSGRRAMAAEQVTGIVGEAGGKVLAVDTARLAAVSAGQPDWSGDADLGRLRSSGVGLVLTGTTVAVRVAKAIQAAQDPETGPTAVLLSLEIARPTGWSTVLLGPLRNGVLRATIPCASGCRVVALTLRNAQPSDQPWLAQFVVTSLSTDRQPASQLQAWLQPSRWRDRIVDETDPTRPAQSEAVGAAGGLGVNASDSNGSATTQLEPAVGSAVVPAVVGSEAQLVEFPGVRSAVLGTSLAVVPILLQPVGRVTAVPRALRTGVLVDLPTILQREDPSLVGAVQQVWLGPTGQASVIAALRAERVTILDEDRASTAVATGLASATNRALLVAGVTALVGILFGLLALVAARVVDMGERRREWATLRLAGVPGRRLGRLALVQIAVPAVIGAVVGVVVGSLSASLIAERLPLLVGEVPGPLLDIAVPFGALAALAGALVLLILAAAVAVSSAEVSRAR